VQRELELDSKLAELAVSAFGSGTSALVPDTLQWLCRQQYDATYMSPKLAVHMCRIPTE
jgi:hypothetical protein